MFAGAAVGRQVTAGRPRELQRDLGRAPPFVPGQGGGAAGLPDGLVLGRLDVLGVRHDRVPGQGAVRVLLDPGQVADQPLHVESAQRLRLPAVFAERAEQAVERVRGARERLIRGDLRHGGHRLAGLAGQQGRRHDPLAQAHREGRLVPVSRAHVDSSSCRSSTVSSLAIASLSRDLAVPSGMPIAFATSRQVSPPK